ncbi:hypothetical protein [Nocardioides sp. Root151]|uniref:hypothetical protein n=1 Tax=Nocardioides sp. Root151 TaxID=1736475 RepID=UPI0007037081|nr:hypothetical protein [Nocardioides sp. Root151]KQZ70615.1 hypothetical protein ASD66_13595 [Nocardioides sp. Root151]
MSDTTPTLRLWHLLIAASAFLGVTLAARQYDVWWTALSQLASLAVGFCYLTLGASAPKEGRRVRNWTWVRGALATLMVLVSLAFMAMQHGNLLDTYSVFEHMVTPTLVVIDFLVVGDKLSHLRWWHPLTWLVPPLAYLAYYLVGDLLVYQALDPAHPASFVRHVSLLLVLVLAAGFGLYAAAGQVDRLRARRSLTESARVRTAESSRFVGVG